MLLRRNNYRNNRETNSPSPLDQGLSFTIRFAHRADEAELRRLAALDCQLPLSGRVLVAEVAAEIWAAVSLDGDQRVIADPFRHTAALAAVLRERAAAGVPASRAHIPVRGAGRPAVAAAR
jgi:hypothetical protein